MFLINAMATIRAVKPELAERPSVVFQYSLKGSGAQISNRSAISQGSQVSKERLHQLILFARRKSTEISPIQVEYQRRESLERAICHYQVEILKLGLASERENVQCRKINVLGPSL